VKITKKVKLCCLTLLQAANNEEINTYMSYRRVHLYKLCWYNIHHKF